MRFFADGPAIPDDLLFARDEGQVLFFCGSGVSLARSRLPDFYGLAADVISALGVTSTSRACAVVDASQRVGQIDGLGGLIAADRVFSMLEEEFETRLVRKEVAKALREKADDLSAHQLILDLARGTDGDVRLVTTNFDLLFERCDPSIPSHSAPDLPDPERADQLRGIIHLHGRITPDYGVPEGEEFVLSSADFGRAYLSEGWATRFISSLLERYQIVFIGYTADDPPIQYLLEALRRSGRPLNRIYAFQAGQDEHAKALWRHRGVKAISYDPANHHLALWKTLEAWAVRARNPNNWNKQVLQAGMSGPVGLAPHQRGQVAHVVSSPAGAAMLEEQEYRLPAQWLCVFDADLRYSDPGNETFEPDSNLIDPFELWSIDSDDVPPPFDPDEPHKKREAPTHAWRAFARGRQDRAPGHNDGSAFYGNALGQVRPLPRRLERLGRWVASVAHQPAALWWAASRNSLHPYVSDRIAVAVEKMDGEPAALCRKGWRYLLQERSSRTHVPAEMEAYALEAEVKREGWSHSIARRLADFRQPRIEIYQALGARLPPEELTRLSAVMQFKIAYSDADVLRELPDDCLEPFVRHLEQAVSHACDLHQEFRAGYYILEGITGKLDGPPFAAPAGNDRSLTGLVQTWMYHISRLAVLRPRTVDAYLAGWRQRHECPFVRAVICALSVPEIVDAATLFSIIDELPDEIFWDHGHQADLLRGLARRWSGVEPELRSLVGRRILRGPGIEPREEPEAFEVRAAYRSLERLSWFLNADCSFDFDAEEETAKLIAKVPQWSPQWAKDADEPGQRGPRTINQDRAPEPLAEVPVDQILLRAEEIMATRGDDGMLEFRPFTGLAERYADRALAALECREAGQHLWAWPTFLGSASRSNDGPEIRSRTARALLNLDENEFTNLLRTICHWLDSSLLVLHENDPVAADELWPRIAQAFRRNPETATSSLAVGGRARDWVFEAINSPPGQLANLAIESTFDQEPGSDIDPRWLERLDDLLALPGDAGRFALIGVLRRIGYLYSRSPHWVEDNLLPRRNLDIQTRVAFWSGVMRSDGLPTALVGVLGSEFARTIGDLGKQEAWRQPSAEFLLDCWVNASLRADGLGISDSDLRSALLSVSEPLRVQVLYTARDWMSRLDGAWREAAEKLIKNVWPRQLESRSTKISIELFRCVLASGDSFKTLAPIVEDLIGPIEGDIFLAFPVNEAVERAGTDAAQLLRLLLRLLPEEADKWPFRIEQVLDALASGDASTDRNLQELRRRWAAR